MSKSMRATLSLVWQMTLMALRYLIRLGRNVTGSGRSASA